MFRPALLLAFATVALLAGCDAAPSDNVAAPAPTGPALPAFAIDPATALDGIAAIGAPWSAAKRSDPMDDAKTGGRVVVMSAPDGSAQVFARAEGKVWQVRLVAGAPGKCGASAPLIAALPKVVAMLKPGTTLTPAQTLAIGNGMTDLRPSTHAIPGMTLTVVGGCTHWLTAAVAA